MTKRKILVVDDEASHRQMLEAVLSAEGYAIKQAEDGQIAIAEVEKCFFDLILMDMSLPVMDGWEAARNGSSDGPRTRSELPCPRRSASRRNSGRPWSAGGCGVVQVKFPAELYRKQESYGTKAT